MLSRALFSNLNFRFLSRDGAPFFPPRALFSLYMTLEGVLCYSPSWEKRKKGLIKTPELNFQSTFYTVKRALGEKRALESIFGAYFGNVLIIQRWRCDIEKYDKFNLLSEN